LLERKIKVVGLDYDEDYVLMARKTIEQHGLQHYVSAVHMSVYDAQTLQTQLQIPGEANSLQPRFDAIYFSGSFSLLPDWAGALISVSPLLKSKGHIFITQTYQRYTPPLLKYIKPLLRYITTINFGELVSETRAAEFFQHQVPEKCHLECVDHEVIKGSVDTSLQAAFITKLRPIQK
jgi:ubiquinone/menaquinone biosynthesis C-methylase UbiE